VGDGECEEFGVIRRRGVIFGCLSKGGRSIGFDSLGDRLGQGGKDGGGGICGGEAWQ
jgi:hypothetical protein